MKARKQQSFLKFKCPFDMSIPLMEFHSFDQHPAVSNIICLSFQRLITSTSCKLQPNESSPPNPETMVSFFRKSHPGREAVLRRILATLDRPVAVLVPRRCASVWAFERVESLVPSFWLWKGF